LPYHNDIQQHLCAGEQFLSFLESAQVTVVLVQI